MNVKEMQDRADRLGEQLQVTRRRLEEMKRERDALAESIKISINQWARQVYDLACEKGWHDEERPREERRGWSHWRRHEQWLALDEEESTA